MKGNPLKPLAIFVRASAAEIVKETEGRVAIKEKRRNCWRVSYMGIVYRDEITTRQVAEFIDGYREKEKVELTPGHREAFRKALQVVLNPLAFKKNKPVTKKGGVL